MNDSVQYLSEPDECQGGSMVSKKPNRSVGRPTDEKKEMAILDSAWFLFLKHGVEAVSIESIADEARVSKVTVYKHFTDKVGLFRACMQRETNRIESVQREDVVANLDLRDTLIQFGLGIMRFIASDTAIDFYSTLSGELRRHKHLAAIFYETGPGKTKQNLAAIIERASKEGKLIIEDSEAGAEQLFGIWQGFSNFELALGVRTDEVRSSIESRVERGVDLFLKATTRKR